jgi:type IV pilus assembly protein PilQ
MLATKCLRKGNSIPLMMTVGLLSLILSCAPAPTKRKAPGPVPRGLATIESIDVTSLPAKHETKIQIISSKTAPYTALKLVQPLRLVVDVTGQPSEGLTGPSVTGDEIIKALTVERMTDEPAVTRVSATLYQDVEYSVQETDGTIDILLSVKKPAETVQPPVVAAKEEGMPETEPRLFFGPGKTELNEVLGIDFFMLPKGKSRVAVTTREKAEYDVRQKDPLTLLLAIKEATIPRELTRYIDSSHFTGVVNQITPIMRPAERSVELEIELKEMVPYHVMQAEGEIRLDFNRTSVKPPPKAITEAKLVKTSVTPEQRPRPTAVTPTQRAVSPSIAAKPTTYRRYTGQRITLDFANADIRNILKLIGEVSKLNLVWGPEVKGTVSMRLKNVPWDQALDIVLESNDLGMIRDGNVIWITTKGKIRSLEKERQERIKAQQERIKATREAEQQAEEAESLVEECIVVNFRDPTEIAEKLTLTARGSKIIDKPTKTICITDIASIIEKARKTIKDFDQPVKQVMIEARIVEAKTTFSRDLGLNWNATYQSTRNPWGGGGPGTDRTYTYTFATNFVTNPETALGFNFANTSGTKVLTAQIGLAETEGTLKTLSAPRIITQHEVAATIKQGTTIYIPFTDIEGNRTAKEVDATLELSVTPSIFGNDMVTMAIEVRDDLPDYANRVGEYVPVLTKSATTKMMVASGDTVVIGGIYKETKGITNTGTPGLRKIPIIGWLFGTESKTIEKTELLIFLTPRVIPVVPVG